MTEADHQCTYLSMSLTIYVVVQFKFQPFTRGVMKDRVGKGHSVLIMNSQSSRGDRQEKKVSGVVCITKSWLSWETHCQSPLIVDQARVGQKKNLH